MLVVVLRSYYFNKVTSANEWDIPAEVQAILGTFLQLCPRPPLLLAVARPSGLKPSARGQSPRTMIELGTRQVNAPAIVNVNHVLLMPQTRKLRRPNRHRMR